MASVEILSATGGIASTNCFVLADEQSKTAVLFDAPDHTTRSVLDEIDRRKWNLIGLWFTHGHFDHIADHEAVTRRHPHVKLLMHALDEPMLERAAIQSELFELPFVIASRSVDSHVEEGQELAIGDLKVRVLHTPGHSPGHVAFWLPDQKVLVGGDLIIAGSIGRTDLPGADPRQMANSLRRIAQPMGARRRHARYMSVACHSF